MPPILEYTLTFLSFSATLSILAYSILKFYKTRHERKGRGMIIAEYKPPEGIRPAMVEVIMTGNITEKLWPVTLIDLAFRKYIEIEEKEDGRNFSMSLVRDFENDGTLYSYEKSVLKMLFPDNKNISSADLKNNVSLKNKISVALIGLKSLVVADVYRHTNTYKRIEERRIPNEFLICIFLVIPLFILLELDYKFLNNYIWYLWLSIAFMLFITLGFLSISTNIFFHKKGFLLREQLKGFKYYLEIAEKDKLEKLPADLFQENLAYAMVFGLEKQWNTLLSHKNATIFQNLSHVFKSYSLKSGI